MNNVLEASPLKSPKLAIALTLVIAPVLLRKSPKVLDFLYCQPCYEATLASDIDTTLHTPFTLLTEDDLEEHVRTQQHKESHQRMLRLEAIRQTPYSSRY